MKEYNHTILFKVLIIIQLIIFGNITINAATQDSVCDVKTLSELMKTQTLQLRKTRDRLVSLIKGEKNTTDEFDISAIFSIDIEDNNLVKNRVQELKANKIPVFEEQYPRCLGIKKELSNSFNEFGALEQKVIQLKINFLEMPLKQRQILVKLSQKTIDPTEIRKQFETEQYNALKEKSLALESRLFAEKLLQTQTSENRDDLKIISEQILLISEQREKTANKTFLLSQYYEKRVNEFTTYNKNLRDHAEKLAKKSDLDILIKEYRNLIILWRTIVDMGIKSMDWPEIKTDEQPGEIPKLLKKEDFSNAEKYFSAYSESYQQLSKNHQKLSNTMKERQQKLINKYFIILIDASNLRSEYIKYLSHYNKVDLFPLNRKYLGDLTREIQVVPYKFFAIGLTRIVEFKHNLTEGFKGIWIIIKDLLAIVLMICTPFVLFYAIKFLTGYIEKLRKKLITGRKPHFMSIKISLWLKNLSPYLPYGAAYISIEIADSLLRKTFFEELTAFLPYFRIIIFYRIFIIFFKAALRRFLFRSKTLSLWQYETKINKTAKATGLFLFIVLSILYAAESTVGRAFIYSLVSNILYTIGFLILLISSYAWRNEIASVIESSTEKNIGKKVADICRGPGGFFLALPLLVLVLFKYILRSIMSGLLNLDLAKKLSARLLRKQMEAAGAKIQTTDIDTLPDEYRELFSFGIPKEPDIWIKPHSGDFEQCIDLIKKWVSGKSAETTIAIYGEKGIGKSSLMELISQEAQEFTVKKIIVPPKLTTEESILSFFGKLFNFDLGDNIEKLLEWDKQAEKTLLLLDDAQNLFLAEINGFQGFKTFLKMINLDLENLFVCSTFNIYSWLFLDSVFGRNKYFRNIMEMSPWTEDDILQLIMTRNNKSAYTLKYDPVITASTLYSENDTMVNSDRKFFRLLWELSDGNPRTAIYSWLTCVTPVGNTLNVSLPREPEGQIFKDLQPDALFIYASLVKHENLTIAEASRTTELPEGLVEYAFKVGLEREFLYRSENGRFRVNPGWHGTVVNFLRDRNLLYVN